MPPSTEHVVPSKGNTQYVAIAKERLTAPGSPPGVLGAVQPFTIHFLKTLIVFRFAKARRLVRRSAFCYDHLVAKRFAEPQKIDRTTGNTTGELSPRQPGTSLQQHRDERLRRR